MNAKQIKEIVEAGGADYVDRPAGNWYNGKGDYIMVNEKGSGSSIMIYLKDLTVKKVQKEIKRKIKEFKNHGKRSVFKIARDLLTRIRLAGATLRRSLGMDIEND
jgi:hypothetical protein